MKFTILVDPYAYGQKQTKYVEDHSTSKRIVILATYYARWTPIQRTE